LLTTTEKDGSQKNVKTDKKRRFEKNVLKYDSPFRMTV